MKLNISTRLNNLFSKKERFGLTLAFEKDGNRFYTFSSPVAPPPVRLESVLARLEMLKLGIRREEQLAFHKTIDEYCSLSATNDPLTALIKIKELNDYAMVVVDQEINLSPMLYLAAPLILLNNEKVKKVDERIEAKKIALANSDPEVMDFFLRQSEQILKAWKNDFEDMNFWQGIKNKGHRFYESQFLKKITSPN